jgi:hypothetical protein
MNMTLPPTAILADVDVEAGQNALAPALGHELRGDVAAVPGRNISSQPGGSSAQVGRDTQHTP